MRTLPQGPSTSIARPGHQVGPDGPTGAAAAGLPPLAALAPLKPQGPARRPKMRLATKPTDLDLSTGSGSAAVARGTVAGVWLEIGRFANGSVRKAGAGEDHEALRNERRPEEGGQPGRFTLGVVTGGPKVLMVLRAEPAPLGRKRPVQLSECSVDPVARAAARRQEQPDDQYSRHGPHCPQNASRHPESAARPRRTSPTASRHRQAHSTSTSPISTSPRPTRPTRHRPRRSAPVLDRQTRLEASVPRPCQPDVAS